MRLPGAQAATPRRRAVAETDRRPVCRLGLGRRTDPRCSDGISLADKRARQAGGGDGDDGAHQQVKVQPVDKTGARGPDGQAAWRRRDAGECLGGVAAADAAGDLVRAWAQRRGAQPGDASDNRDRRDSGWAAGAIDWPCRRVAR